MSEPHLPAAEQDGQAPALIYIVDDDLSIARLLTHVLTEFGFLAEAFGTGAAVLRRLQTTRPDLCIVDRKSVV